MITILDYGMGNVKSILNIIYKVGGEAIISSDINKIIDAEKIILPGIGSFDVGIKNLTEQGLISILNKKVLDEKTPFLGICLGMQLITQRSEEGKLNGLGWINAETEKFRSLKDNLKVPHMGWNYVTVKKKSKLFKDMYDNPRFYFVHSYYVRCKDKNDILTTTEYGFNFVSAIEKDNIYATQFHPEKSHKFGMKLMENFVKNV
ncbi:Imidazole glycerol phosphate synthase subunit HisH [uncultured archaeon]|nr:Imidazole glycerol phosphate synthase subunit HisH [uncultured archaeon]